ncbi:hypothetical protein FHU29_004168 [Hoyosella altamirensis]|nr:hypothetical protein [Hoyosella altamirensis]
MLPPIDQIDAFVRDLVWQNFGAVLQALELIPSYFP